MIRLVLLTLCTLMLSGPVVGEEHKCLQTIECKLLRPDCANECENVKPSFHTKYRRCMDRCNKKARQSSDRVLAQPTVKGRPVANTTSHGNEGEEAPTPVPEEWIVDDDKCAKSCTKKFIFLVRTLDPDFSDDNRKSASGSGTAPDDTRHQGNEETDLGVDESAAFSAAGSPAGGRCGDWGTLGAVGLLSIALLL
ncbi:hypothetical protein IWQ60_005718 [Tieghemiomyces parasiticus]|uniref:Uncharacterized protein n=1 Tax=Tieghemiomyces parasiticus TaxID=78921 RepID=A0A9W8A5S1_9FUNG|nr:hypothetical protein IWQ60_005718 [Tieghemiomyces parasiticus]